MPHSYYVVMAFVAATALLSWGFYRRAAADRPPIGVVTLRDVAILLIVLVLLPYLYLNLPVAAVTTVLALGVLTAMYVTLEPALRRAWLAWTTGVGLVAADITLGVSQGVTGAPFLVINNIIMVITIVGATNLWAQSGMRARDVTVLAAGLTVYDVIATQWLSVMTDVMQRLSTAPLVPIVAWGLADERTALRIGLGDLLLLTVFPLVMRKAFGRTAGVVALAIGLATPAVILGVLAATGATVPVPAMAFLGPSMVAQYLWWRRTRTRERTTREYLLAEPAPQRLWQRA